MRAQRNLFFSSRQRRPRKDGENRPVSARRRAALDPAQLDVRFTSESLTAFGGYPLWARFLDGLGFEQKLAQHVKISRGANAFTAAELSRFFIDTRVLGAERLHHVDEMRHDPLLTRTYGIDTLPSDETLGRYFKSFEAHQLAALDRLTDRLNNQLWKRSRGQRRGPAKDGRIVLDYDSTTTTVYGEQAGADRGYSFRKKDQPGFQPKFAFIGGLGIMLHQRLYPQSVNLNREFEEFHRETLARLPKTATVWAVRGDGALYKESRLNWFEQQGYVFAISASRTSHLRREIELIPEAEWEEGIDELGRPYSIARLHYRPKTWSAPRTFIVSRRLRDSGSQQTLAGICRYRYFGYVTNLRAPLVTQFRFCVERCSLESFIKESKNGLFYDALPCRERSANLAYLAHVQLAFNLLIWWKLLEAPATVERWSIDTLRLRVLAVCGQLRRHAGRWLLLLPAAWPWRSLLREMYRSVGFVVG